MNDFNSKVLKDFLVNKSVECTLNTLDHYERTIRNFLIHIKKDVREIDFEDITNWLKDINDHYAPFSILSKYKTLTTFFNFCLNEDYIKSSPIKAKWHRPKYVKFISKSLDKEDLVKVKIASESLVLRNRTLIELMQCTGLRCHEVNSLNIGDVDLKEKSITFIGKGDKGGIVYFSKRCRLLLEKLIANRQKTDPLFIHLHSRNYLNKRLSTRSIYVIVKNLEKNIKLKRVLSPHVLRHSYATELYRQGNDMKVIQQLMRHSFLSQTSGYIQIFLEEAMSEYHRAMR